MGGELVRSSSPDGEVQESAPPIAYTEQFYEAFPFYLSIGMTAEQYWDGDVNLPKYYREAQELRDAHKNQEMWLQGMYIYEALCDVAPVLQAFAKRGTKATPYSKEPYAITSKERMSKEEKAEKAKYEKSKARMEAIMASVNKRFNK